VSPVGIRSIREGRWMLVVAHEPLRESVSLFDDVSDPRHRVDHIDDQSIEAASLRARLDEAFGALARAAYAGAERDLDPETAAQLQKLGYLGGGK
jgi:hypothetical protein